MALWAVSNPLIMPNDFNKVRPDVREVMQQKEIMAAYKDAMAVQGKRVYKKNDIQVWVKPIYPKIGEFDSCMIVVLKKKVQNMMEKFSLPLKDLGLKAPLYNLKDMYSFENSSDKPTSTLDVFINPAGVIVLRAEPVL